MEGVSAYSQLYHRNALVVYVRVCMYICMCVWLLLGELLDQLDVPSTQSAAVLTRKHACREACRQADTEVLFWQPAPINNPAVIL